VRAVRRPGGEEALTSLDPRPFAELAAEAKLEQATTTFSREVDWLDRIQPGEATARKLASLPVYRTYDGGRSAEDREALEHAGLPDLYDDRSQEWITRFQQTSPPVMAKGVEDTAFYRYVRLLALNDVGGDPSRFGITVDQFHSANLIRAERYPRNLLVTQTHDTKRSGDVRARIGALSTMADEYVALAREWLREGAAPTEHEQLFVFQTMLGAHPISEERVRGYLEKALREASSPRTGSSPTRSTSASSPTSPSRCRRFPGLRRVRREGRRGRPPRRHGPAAAQAHRPRRPRPLPGRRARRALARRSRQPPRRSTGRSAASCCKPVRKKRGRTPSSVSATSRSCR
jgi:(1->4)-alpha-D-glucan 1-alpha-D-glucosylmutase